MKKALQLLLIAIITIVSSCKKNEITTTPDPIVPFENAKTITTIVAGKVTSQDGTPLNNVEITIGTSTTVTDINGNFIIPKATLSEKAGFIKATKAGYFGGSRTIIAKEKVINNIVIQLVKKTISSDFTNATGGTVTVTTGGSVVFPANAVVTKSGAAYSGTVKVSAYFLDPTSNNCYKEMPGDLRGINVSNNEQVLTSYGMMAVELNGSNGEALQLATGKNATVTFPIAAATQSKAPTTIPLWFFDETKGMWVEQGSATKTGNNYVGTVSHFTWWNCDYGGGSLTYTAKFVDQNGNPLSNYHVYFITSNGWGGGGGHGWTASDGSLTGNIPANTSIIIKVEGYCGNTPNIIYTAAVGPFTQNTNAGTITVTLSSSSTTISVKGTVVDCSNNPVLNGYATIHFNNQSYYAYVNNGAFTVSNTYCTTVPTGTATIDVFDLTTLKQNTTSTTVNITGAGTFNFGQIAACGVQNFIRYTATFINQNGYPVYQGSFGPTINFGNDSLITYDLHADSLIAIIPINKAVLMKIYSYDACNAPVLSDSSIIGPFTSNFNAGAIILNYPEPGGYFTINGQVKDCNNNNVATGLAIITLDNGQVYSAAIANGTFSQTVYRCRNTQANIAINVFDYTNHQQNSTPITVSVTNTNVNIGTVQACGVNTNEFFDYNLGSNPTKSVVDTSSAYLNMGQTNLRGASGNFTTGITYFYGTIDGSSIGTHPITITLQEKMYVQQQKFYNSQIATTTITEYGSVGQYITGTFTGTMQENNTNNVLPITGSFRIKRTQ